MTRKMSCYDNIVLTDHKDFSIDVNAAFSGIFMIFDVFAVQIWCKDDLSTSILIIILHI